MSISKHTLLPVDTSHAVAFDIGIAIKPISVRDNVIELDIVAIITDVSDDFSMVVIVLNFFISLFDLMFLSLE